MNKPENLIEDVEDLIKAGEWPGRIAARLGYKGQETLERALNNCGRNDITLRLRQLDRSSHAYQLAHNTPMDEAVARDKQRYLAKKRAAA